MKLSESKLRNIITECVKQVLSEKMKSKKLWNIVQKHGGVKSNPLFDLHNMTDEDIIDVVDRQTLYSFKTERDLRNFGINKGFNLRPSDTVEYMELKDGMYLIGVLRAGAFDYTNDINKDTSDGNFEALSQKRDARYKNRDNGYQWQNQDAEELFNNPFFRRKEGAWKNDSFRQERIQQAKHK